MTNTGVEMSAESVVTPAAADRLREAVEQRQFVLHYQPKMDARSRSITGVEALMRWNDPATGLVDPARFLPALEASGLIIEVGQWAMRQALADARAWRDLGHNIRVAVNVAGTQLADPGFTESVKRALDEAQLKEGMDLELAESDLVADVERSIAALHVLKGMGVNVAVDHFGSSRSSLPWLARMPVNSVKIDGLFSEGAVRDSGTRTVVGTLISLAHAMGYAVIAKGVESEEQWKLLRSLHCDEVQGYLFSPARPAANITRMLQVQGGPLRRFLR